MDQVEEIKGKVDIVELVQEYVPLKRDGKVYAQIIPDASQAEILPIIRATIKGGADIFIDGWKSYDALAVYGYNHKKVNHEKNDFAHQDIHINGVESFWSWTK